MTSATEELRRLLDERGVEFHEYHSQISGSMESTTRFYLHDNEHHPYAVIEVGSVSDNALLTLRCTKEQAVEATLGRGTCRRVLYNLTGVLVCSECGVGMPKQLDKYCYLHYCPNCGREVIE